MNARISPALAVLLLLFCGCAALPFSAPYDPAFDAALAGFGKDAEALFDDLGRAAGTPGSGWERFDSAYRSLDAQLDALTQQVILRDGHPSTLEALDLVRENLAACEALHRDGIAPAEVGVVRRLIAGQVRMLLQLERARRGAGKEGL
jgi:hypothetical protein